MSKEKNTNALPFKRGKGRPNTRTLKERNISIHEDDVYVPKRHNHRGQAKVASKANSVIPADMNRREYLMYALGAQTYECMICCEVILKNRSIWSCSCCYAVFHLNCITKWSQSSVGGHGSVRTKWRCPSCQYERQSQPLYTCFCGKLLLESRHGVRSDEDVQLGSCGQTCGKLLSRDSNCQHKCPLSCHPGPCEECLKWVECVCSCGKEKVMVKCSEYNASSKIQCGKECGTVRDCGHVCNLVCHSGNCPPCDVIVDESCFCGDTVKSVKCYERFKDGFSCGKSMSLQYSCGNHEYIVSCGKNYNELKVCPRDPSILKSCPCGKIAYTNRKTCLDPVPEVCGAKCTAEFLLECGHLGKCKLDCHYGDCIPGECMEIITKKCRCGSEVRKDALCSDFKGEFVCKKVCGRSFACGKHKCLDVCCNKPLKDHYCKQHCEKLLPCKKHACPRKCHKGQCGSCKFVSYDQYVCHCGRTVVDPPIRCSDTIPRCDFTCMRSLPCGHDSVLRMTTRYHSCHLDDEACPKCTLMVDKQCLCGKTMAKNVWCSSTPRCSSFCDMALECGHKCNQPCHAPGDCLAVCSQKCGQTLNCGHICPKRCHFGEDCDQKCITVVDVQCMCGNLKQKASCFEVTSWEQPTLDCNQECEQIERNRRFAAALQLENVANGVPQLKLPAPTDFIEAIILRHPSVCRAILTKLKDYFEGEDRVLRFPPMNEGTRRLVHEVVTNYGTIVGLITESEDNPPFRSVIVVKRKPKDALGKISKQMFKQMLESLISLSHSGKRPVKVSEEQEAKVWNGQEEQEEPEPTLFNFDCPCILDHSHLVNTEPRLKVALMSDETSENIVAIKAKSGVDLVALGEQFKSSVAFVVQNLMDEANLLVKYPCGCTCDGCKLEMTSLDDYQKVLKTAGDFLQFHFDEEGLVRIDIASSVNTKTLNWLAWTALELAGKNQTGQ